MSFNYRKILLFGFLAVFSILNSFSQIKIKAVGDVMPGSLTPVKILPPDNANSLIPVLSGFFKGADIVFGNLEGTFVKESFKPVKCSDSSRAKGICYEFGIPEELVFTLKAIGFNVFNLDNNHSMDYGNDGYLNTLQVLTSNGFSYAPPKGHSFFQIRNKKAVIIPFCFENYSNNLSDLNKVSEIVQNYRQKYDYVIVSFHGGAEGKNAQHTKDTKEIFLGEDRGNVMKFAHTAVDAGACAVLGHGPHVLRAMELYKNKLIAYSLGNFFTYGNFNLNGVNSFSVILDFEIAENEDFSKGKLIPIMQKKPGIPEPDKNCNGIKLIKQLTEEDFPDGVLLIDNFGNLTKK